MDGAGCELDRSRLQMCGERPQMSRVGCEHLAESASSQSQLPGESILLRVRGYRQVLRLSHRRVARPAAVLLALPLYCPPRRGIARAVTTNLSHDQTCMHACLPALPSIIDRARAQTLTLASLPSFT